VRITLQDAGASRLDIDLSVDGEVRRVSLAGLRSVVGQVERASSAARVSPLRADSLVLAALEWPLQGGRLCITSPATLEALAVELDSAAGPDATPSGRITAGRVEGDAIACDVRGARLVFDAELQGTSVEHTPERVGHAAADKLDLGNLQAVLNGALCRLSSAVLERARVDWRTGELLIGAAGAVASGINVTAAGMTIDIDRVELPGGLRTSGGALVIPELIAPEVRIAVDDVVELFRPKQPRAEAAPRAPFDYGFLDRLSGRLDVDMTLDMTLPVLGRREGTHHFRVPIANGIINYRELERDLASFEDAFIDVEVRGQQLVIERDIPLIPGLEKPLVMWDLDADELELARRRLVRLRTIPRLRMAARGDSGDKSSLVVRSLRFDNVDIAIALLPPQPGQADSIGRASAGALRVTGRLAHEPNRTAHGAEVTRATCSGSTLAAGPLELGGRIAVQSIELGALTEVSAAFSGLRPGRVSLTGRDLRLQNLRVQLSAPEAAGGRPPRS
jgi:hypothetical protein